MADMQVALDGLKLVHDGKHIKLFHLGEKKDYESLLGFTVNRTDLMPKVSYSRTSPKMSNIRMLRVDHVSDKVWDTHAVEVTANGDTINMNVREIKHTPQHSVITTSRARFERKKGEGVCLADAGGDTSDVRTEAEGEESKTTRGKLDATSASRHVQQQFAMALEGTEVKEFREAVKNYQPSEPLVRDSETLMRELQSAKPCNTR